MHTGLADGLHSTAIGLLRRLRKQDDASGLSAPRLSALSVLVFGGERTLKELAAAEQVRPPTMTKLVHALEEARLVARAPHPQDGRAILLRATAAGRKVLQSGRARRVQALEGALASLRASDLAALERALPALRRALEALDARSASRAPPPKKVGVRA